MYGKRKKMCEKWHSPGWGSICLEEIYVTGSSIENKQSLQLINQLSKLCLSHQYGKECAYNNNM